MILWEERVDWLLEYPLMNEPVVIADHIIIVIEYLHIYYTGMHWAVAHGGMSSSATGCLDNLDSVLYYS